MRPVGMSDLLCAGRAVMAVSPRFRAHAARALVRNADVADRFRVRNGAQHPRFGDGTLAAASRRAGMICGPTTCDRAFANALILVLQTLVDYRPDH